MRLLSLCLFVFANCNRQIEPPTPAAEPTPPRPEVVEVRVDEVANSYRRNPVAADLKYKAKRLQFDELLVGMDSSPQGVTLGFMFGPTTCLMRPGQEEALAKLAPNESKVRMRASVVRMGRFLELDDCELVSQFNMFDELKKRQAGRQAVPEKAPRRAARKAPPSPADEIRADIDAVTK